MAAKRWQTLARHRQPYSHERSHEQHLHYNVSLIENKMYPRKRASSLGRAVDVMIVFPRPNFRQVVKLGGDLAQFPRQFIPILRRFDLLNPNWGAINPTCLGWKSDHVIFNDANVAQGKITPTEIVCK